MIRTSPKFARIRVRNFIISVTSHDPDRVIFNFFDHVLNTTEKSLLSKGLNFLIPPKNINYADFMQASELLCRNFDSSEISNLYKEFSENRLRDQALSSCKDTGETLGKNLPKEEFDSRYIPTFQLKTSHPKISKLFKSST